MKNLINRALAAEKKIFLFIALTTAFAAANAQTPNPHGSCGDHLTWELDLGTGQLIISGYGEMDDYQYSYSSPWHSNASQILSVSLPNGLTTIGKYAFADLDEVTTITLPNSVTTIANCAFYGCKKLATLNLGKVKEIGSNVFYYCDALATLTLPNTLQTIGYRAFYYSGIKTITIPASVTSLDLNAFEHSKLETLVLNNTINKVPGQLCYVCYSLTSVTIPEGIKTIGDGAFYSCTALPTITLPSTVTVIDASFEDCTGLTSITCKAVEPPVAHNEVFKNVPKTIPVYVPAGSVNKYKTASKWEEFGDYIQAIPGTAIDETTKHKSEIINHKYISSGQLYILRDDKTYTILGAEVK